MDKQKIYEIANTDECSKLLINEYVDFIQRHLFDNIQYDLYVYFNEDGTIDFMDFENVGGNSYLNGDYCKYASHKSSIDDFFDFWDSENFSHCAEIALPEGMSEREKFDYAINNYYSALTDYIRETTDTYEILGVAWDTYQSFLVNLEREIEK